MQPIVCALLAVLSIVRLLRNLGNPGMKAGLPRQQKLEKFI